MRKDAIGEAAGVVFRYLEQNGKATAGTLSRKTDLTTSRVHQAIGWLAREDKIEVVRKGRRMELRLLP